MLHGSDLRCVGSSAADLRCSLRVAAAGWLDHVCLVKRADSTIGPSVRIGASNVRFGDRSSWILRAVNRRASVASYDARLRSLRCVATSRAVLIGSMGAERCAKRELVPPVARAQTRPRRPQVDGQAARRKCAVPCGSVRGLRSGAYPRRLRTCPEVVLGCAVPRDEASSRLAGCGRGWLFGPGTVGARTVVRRLAFIDGRRGYHCK